MLGRRCLVASHGDVIAARSDEDRFRGRCGSVDDEVVSQRHHPRPIDAWIVPRVHCDVDRLPAGFDVKRVVVATPRSTAHSASPSGARARSSRGRAGQDHELVGSLPNVSRLFVVAPPAQPPVKSRSSAATISDCRSASEMIAGPRPFAETVARSWTSITYSMRTAYVDFLSPRNTEPERSSRSPNVASRRCR